jgi:hypothetical protein
MYKMLSMRNQTQKWLRWSLVELLCLHRWPRSSLGNLYLDLTAQDDCTVDYIDATNEVKLYEVNIMDSYTIHK